MTRTSLRVPLAAVTVLALVFGSVPIVLAGPATPAAAAAGAPEVGRPDARPEVKPIRRVDVEQVARRPGTLQPRPGRRDLPPLDATLKAASGESPRIAAAVTAAPSQSTSSGQPAPNQVTGFDGLDAADNAAVYCGGVGLCIEPPDPWVAAGKDHVVQAVNSLFQFSERDGDVVVDVDPFDFYLLPLETDGVADPRVIYDALHERWIAIQISWECGSPSFGFLDIAWSDTSDPLDDWWISGFSYDGFLPDYPGIGTSTDKVVMSANVFSLPDESVPGAGDCTDLITTYDGTDVLVMDWAALVNVGPTLPFEGFSTDASYFTWRPAVMAPATNAIAHLIVGRATADPEIVDVGYARITGTVAGDNLAVTATQNLTSLGVVDPFMAPPDAVDPGGAMGSVSRPIIDERPTDAIWQANELTFVSTFPCTPTGDSSERACGRVVQLNTAPATPTLVQDLLVAANGKDTFLPGVGVALNGTLHVVYSRSSSTEGASSYAAYQRPSDAVNTLSAPLMIGDAQNYAYDGDRWGDYVGVAQDPHDYNAVWQGDQHTASDGRWVTTVSQLYTASATFHEVEPVRLLDTRIGNGLVGAMPANIARAFIIAGRGGIPANAVAVTGNLTVTNQQQAGYVTLSPNPTATPQTSTLNFPVGDVRANNVTIPLSPTGRLAAIYKAATGKTTHLVFDVTGYFTNDDSGATYNTAGPVRLLDTRHANGLSGVFTSGTPRTWDVAGRGGIPEGAVAVTGNLTVTNQTGAGYVSVTPTPIADPGTSTLNFPVGDVRANGLTVPLHTDGSLSAVYKSGLGKTTHLVFDVTGYYLDDLTGARFVPLGPGRRLDTRHAIGLAGKFTSSVPRWLVIRAFTGVALDAEAVTGNLTVVNQTGAGYVSITTTPQANPTTSTLNFPVGDVRANGVTVPLNPGNGAFSLTYKSGTGAKTDLILDMTGYFR